MGFGFSRGNILFLILLAVALFAALSYAVTQSNRSGGNNISDEDARLAASQITQYATLLESTVSRLRLINGCRDTQISFAYDSDGDGNWYDTDDDYHNPNAPSDFRCHIFHASGGNVPRLPLEAGWFNPDLSAETYYQNTYFSVTCLLEVGTTPTVGTCNTDSSNTQAHGDLMLFIPTLTRAVCERINKNLRGNISIGTDTTPLPNGDKPFEGSYEIITSHTNGTNITGFASGCLSSGGAPERYIYYHALIPR